MKRAGGFPYLLIIIKMLKSLFLLTHFNLTSDLDFHNLLLLIMLKTIFYFI